MFAERILERSISVILRDLEVAGNLYIYQIECFAIIGEPRSFEKLERKRIDLKN